MPVLEDNVYFYNVCRNPYYNVAFCVDQLEGEGTLSLLFAGLVESKLHPLFKLLTSANGAATAYRIEYRQAPFWRNGYVSEWLEVTLTGYNHDAISTEMVATMVRQWLTREVKVTTVDRYTVYDFLNLTDSMASRRIKDGAKSRHATAKKASKDEAQADDDATTTTNDYKPTNKKSAMNIYLKVPWCVAWHFRGRDEEHQLTEFEPVTFTKYDHEYQMLMNNLRFIPEERQTRMCYSQSAWRNILHGRKPEGGASIIDRNPSVWPNINETATLTGCMLTGKHSSTDYLCIEMPREVRLGSKILRTNQSYSLSYDCAYHFAAMLYDRFAYEYTQWIEQDMRTAAELGFKRKGVESQERYFEQFNFPINISEKQRESLRRQHTRFITRGHGKPRYLFQFGEGSQSYMEHIGEHEQRRIDERQRREERLRRKIADEDQDD